jgi:hypothetical protein
VSEREIELVRGTALLGADRWDDERKRESFMAIFHPGYTDEPTGEPAENEDADGEA